MQCDFCLSTLKFLRFCSQFLYIIGYLFIFRIHLKFALRTSELLELSFSFTSSVMNQFFSFSFKLLAQDYLFGLSLIHALYFLSSLPTSSCTFTVFNFHLRSSLFCHPHSHNLFIPTLTPVYPHYIFLIRAPMIPALNLILQIFFPI